MTCPLDLQPAETRDGETAASPAGLRTRGLSVLTFNAGLLAIRLGAALVPAVPQAGRRVAALPAELRALGADVLALQEVVAESHRQFLAEALRDSYPFGTLATRGSGATARGLLILSRFPVMGCRLSGGSAVLEADIRVPGLGPIVVATTHLPPRLLPGLSDRARRRGIDALIAALADRDAILAGDLNAGPEVDARAYRRLLEAGFVDAVAVANGDAAGPTWSRANPLAARGVFRYAACQRIDHVLVSPAAARRMLTVRAARVLEGAPVPMPDGRPVPLSDHYGVLAQFRRG